MTWLALHRDPALTLAAGTLLIPPEQVAAFDDTLALAQALRERLANEEARIAAAERAGHARGRAEGTAQAHAEAAAAAAQALSTRLAVLDAEAARERQALHEAVLPLALLVLRRLAATEAPERVLAALLRRSLGELLADAGRRCTVRLHPAQLAPVRGALGELAGQFDWRADDTLAPLDAVIDTPGGRLLAGLETQLARVQAALVQPPRRAEARTRVAAA
jgi:type III secretion protein L